MSSATSYRTRGLVFIVAGVLILLIIIQLYAHNSNYGKGETVFLPALLSAALDLAEIGGREVKHVHSLKNIEIKSKGETAEGAQEFVTMADRLSHRKIVSGLNRVWPNLNVISEERDKVDVEVGVLPDLNRSEVKEFKLTSFASDFVEINDITVWVDPLDATQEYTENLLEYVTVMICVAYKGSPLMGVVHQPFKNKTYYAWVGKGYSFPAANATSKKDKFRIIVSRSHAGDVEKKAKKLMGGKVEVIHAGGSGYKTLKVLEGAADVYLHVTKIKKWDICAPNALLAAVHGSMTTLNGDSIDYSGKYGPANNNGLLASLQQEGLEDLLEAINV